ncbi:MAG: LuxR C-terminal-related transcriptional regulator [Oscillospiraceae bacterium]|nr:LuxR C-terminal-related transcriptional regulator [Oscillospiraceae bacterium]
MLTPNIHNNKYAPAVLPETAPRDDFLADIERAADKKLIFISAPGDSGKTASAVLWINKTSRKTAWIGLDVYDNSASIFYKMFCTGILSAQPHNDRVTAILQDTAFSSAPVEHTIMLLAEFILDENEYVLVLDDFHTITNLEILKSLPYILRRLPHSFVTLILSRNEPDEYLAEYMEENQAVIIGDFPTAELLLEQNKLNESLTEARAAIRKLTEFTPNEQRFAAYMQLAAVYLAADREDELAALLKEIYEFINERAQLLLPNFLAFTTRIKLWNGDRTAAQEWIDSNFANESMVLEPCRIYQYFTTVRAYAVLGELDRAKDFAARLRQTAKDYHRPQRAAEAGVLLSAILWAKGNRDEAQSMMETVLSETQPYSFVRLIADEGAAILQVLKKISGKTEHVNYQGVLDPVYVNGVYIAAFAVGKKREGIISELDKKTVKLSKQQKMIISLLAQGYKRESIIEKTGLSLGTVKSYTRIAYEKLGAGNAADAVAKARELGIIEM